MIDHPSDTPECLLGMQEKPIPSCSFCGKPHSAVQKLIAGPEVNICDECVTAFDKVLKGGPDTTMASGHRVCFSDNCDPTSPELEHPCSFCGKLLKEVRGFVLAPHVSACDECIGLCLEIVNEYKQVCRLRSTLPP